MKTHTAVLSSLESLINKEWANESIDYNNIDEKFKSHWRKLMNLAHLKSLEGKLDFELIDNRIIRCKLINNFVVDFRIMAGIDHSAIYPMQGSIDFRVQQKTIIELQEFGAVDSDDRFEYMSNYKSEGGLLKTIKAELKKVEIQAKKGNVKMEYKYFLRTYRSQQWNWQNDERFTLWTLFKYNNEKNQSWNYFGCDALFQGMSKDPKSFKGNPFQSTKNEWKDDKPPLHHKNYKEFLKYHNIDIDDVKR